MPRTTTIPSEPREIAILSRLLLNGWGGLTQELARHLLGLGFDQEDKARMHELAETNRAGTISPAELQELDSYVKAGDWLAILQAKARKFFKARPK
jgi:hypothetical protein